MRQFFILLGGLLFGAGLVISGMTDPAKVIGFLDLFGEWDPALAFVMGGAVLTFGVGYLVLKQKSGQSSAIRLPDMSPDPIAKRLIVGSVIFGVGWGISGFCPGPALANLAAARTEALVFVPLMLIGMIAAQRIFSLDR